MCPLGRFGSVEEAAGPVLFFCSPLSDYVSGEIFTVSGGGRAKASDSFAYRTLADRGESENELAPRGIRQIVAARAHQFHSIAGRALYNLLVVKPNHDMHARRVAQYLRPRTKMPLQGVHQGCPPKPVEPPHAAYMTLQAAIADEIAERCLFQYGSMAIGQPFGARKGGASCRGATRYPTRNPETLLSKKFRCRSPGRLQPVLAERAAARRGIDTRCRSRPRRSQRVSAPIRSASNVGPGTLTRRLEIGGTE